MVCILWKRLGFELPPDYRRADGTTPTGTEYEFEDAMQAARSKGSPDVLVYRKVAPVLLDAEQVETERAQFEALKQFWTRWFRTETGHFTAAYQSFETTDQLETQVEDHIRLWLARRKVAAVGLTWPIEQLGSPFRGLQPFDAEHAAVFFGRRRIVERARERLTEAAQRGGGFLLILCTSGSGKSSLARAGLVPRLSQPGAVSGVDVWRCCVMRPSEGETPIHALARVLYRPEAVAELASGDTPSPADLAQLLAGAPEAAARAVRLALARGTAALAAREGFVRAVEARLLLVVDQFEEALAPPDARDAFARTLAALVATGVVWVIATLRSDLYAAFQASPPLMALRDGGAQLDLGAPGAAELAEIIAGPAAAAGLRFDTRPDGAALDEELAAAADQPGALPLLQLTLDALFEARDPAENLLTFTAYDALGGLPGVVERRAEATLGRLDAAAAAALPGVLGALVGVTGEGVVTSRAVPARQAATNADAVRLVDAFVAARLLVADNSEQETMLRVAHDALLLGWPRAAALIAADREALRTRGRVDAAAQRWVQEQRDREFLLPPGRPLAEAVELAAHRADALEPATAAFIAASRDVDAERQAVAAAHAQRELRLEVEAQQARADAATQVVRRTRIAAAVVSVLLVAAVGAAGFATIQRQEARRQTVQAEQNFKAALDGGASLIDAVNDHLRDGGMTRQVARALLSTASTTLGGLVGAAAGALPPLLQDTRIRLQAGFSSVQLALCDSAGARQRAQDAVSIAEAVALQAPSEARQLALVTAQDTLGLALRADGDARGAVAVYRGAEAGAAAHGVAAGTGPLRAVRRDLATALLDLRAWEPALALLHEDLQWQRRAVAANGHDVAAAALEANDLRLIALAALGGQNQVAAAEALEQEAQILHRLSVLQPANAEWQRGLSINAGQAARLAASQRNLPVALARAREAADLATTVLAHDPENAEWQRDLVYADIRLGGVLASNGDLAATVGVLRPAIARVKSLTGPQSSSQLCRGDAATLHGIAGNALMLTGDTAAAVEELRASLTIVKASAAAAPDDMERLHGLMDPEASLARIYGLADNHAAAAEHDRAGIEAARLLVGRAAGNVAWQDELAAVRLHLGGELQKAGDFVGAIAAYDDNLTASESLAVDQPERLEWRREIVASLLGIATTQLLSGRPDLQWRALQRCLTEAEQLFVRQPGSTAFRYSLIETLDAVAAAELARREFAPALTHFREALGHAEMLVAQEPTVKRWKIEHAVALNYVGIAYKFSGQPDEAQAYFSRGKSAMEAAQADGRR